MEARRPKNSRLEAQEAIASEKNRFQVKLLSANVNSTGIMGDLTFNNLVIGKHYRIGGQILIFDDTNGVTQMQGFLNYEHDGEIIGRTVFGTFVAAATLTDLFGTNGPNSIFTATASTLEFNLTTIVNMRVAGSNSRTSTHIILEELNDYEETTDFT